MTHLDKGREEGVEIHGEVQLKLDVVVAIELVDLGQVGPQLCVLKPAEPHIPLEDVVLDGVGLHTVLAAVREDADQVID